MSSVASRYSPSPRLHFCHLPALDVSLIGLALQRRLPGSPRSFVSCALMVLPCLDMHPSSESYYARMVFPVGFCSITRSILGTDLDLSRHWESPSRVYRNPQYTVTVRTSPMPPTRTHIFCSPSLLLQTRTPFGYTGDIFVIKGPSFSTSSASFVPISSHPFTKFPPTSRKHIKHHEPCWLID